MASAHHLHAPPTCPSSSGKISDTDLSHHLRPWFTSKQRLRRKQLGDAPDPVHRVGADPRRPARRHVPVAGAVRRQRTAPHGQRRVVGVQAAPRRRAGGAEQLLLCGPRLVLPRSRRSNSRRPC
ncbi:hypothetical protein G3M48_004342 [Beauveria asiatica]|uniref:Uncharacterized protein n=1 Tax=Beauveria asiatica TaxID=1069075 RepID=A0AAW0RT91_9HYPO